MKVLITGSRNWDNAFAVHTALVHLLAVHGSSLEVIQGGARGADRIALSECLKLGIKCRTFHANWEEHGRRAGILRNIEMLNENPDLVIAFWDGESRGTAHTIAEAANRDIAVEVVS